jgi:hypothetical protein
MFINAQMNRGRDTARRVRLIIIHPHPAYNL